MEKISYDLDVALDVISTLKVIRIKELEQEKDADKKEVLKREITILSDEEQSAFLGNMQPSIIDKAIRLYAPILKQYYATH